MYLPALWQQGVRRDTSRIVEAIVVLHGLQRNGDDYYRAAYKLLLSSAPNRKHVADPPISSPAPTRASSI